MIQSSGQNGAHHHIVNCPDCGAPMVLRTTQRFHYSNGQPRKFYGCCRWPECTATHGAHEDGRPLGIPGNAETKAARSRAHQKFDLLWSGNSPVMTRPEAYVVMRQIMNLDKNEAHIGRFNVQQCDQLILGLDKWWQDNSWRK